MAAKTRIHTLALAALLCLAGSLAAGAKDREIYLSLPIPQGKFPPAWTDSIRISVTDDDEVIQDHRHFKKGSKDFRAVLSGALHNKAYSLEVLCLGKEGKPIAVFQQQMTVKATTKKFLLNTLKYVETLDEPKAKPAAP